MSVLEGGREGRRDVLEALQGRPRYAHVVGITGAPGAGKSSLAAALGDQYIGLGERVAILAVDPTSPRSGGAVLGDRVRMGAVSRAPGAFVRSMASRGNEGGLARSTADAAEALSALGFDRVLVETVGTGQGEVRIADVADTVVVVSVPGLGDGLQVEKAGILEIADVHVVHKADREGAGRIAAELRAQFGGVKAANGWEAPVIPTSIVENQGLDTLVAAIDQHADHLHCASGLAERRKDAVRRRLFSSVRETLIESLIAWWDSASLLDQLIDEVAVGHRDLDAVVDEILHEFVGGQFWSPDSDERTDDETSDEEQSTGAGL